MSSQPKLAEDSPSLSVNGTDPALDHTLSTGAKKTHMEVTMVEIPMLVSMDGEKTIDLSPLGIGIKNKVAVSQGFFHYIKDAKVYSVEITNLAGVLERASTTTPRGPVMKRFLGPGKPIEGVATVKCLSKSGKEEEIVALKAYGTHVTGVGGDGSLFVWSDSDYFEDDPHKVPKTTVTVVAKLGIRDDNKVKEAFPGGTFVVLYLGDDSFETIKYCETDPDPSVKLGRLVLPRNRTVVSVTPGHDHCALVARNMLFRGEETDGHVAPKVYDEEGNEIKTTGLSHFNIYVTGSNSFGQLGLGDTKNRPGWNQVKTGSIKTMNILASAANENCTFALSHTGEVAVSGHYLGDLTKKPVLVDFNAAFTDIACQSQTLIGCQRHEEGEDDVWLISTDETGKVTKVEHNGDPISKLHSLVTGPTHFFLGVEVKVTQDDKSKGNLKNGADYDSDSPPATPYAAA